MQRFRLERLFANVRSCVLATRGSVHTLLPRKIHEIIVLLEASITITPALTHSRQDTQSKAENLQQLVIAQTHRFTGLPAHARAPSGWHIEVESVSGSQTASLDGVEVANSRYLSSYVAAGPVSK